MDKIVEFQNDYPIVSGIMAILIAIALILYLKDTTKTWRMSKNSVASWKVLVSAVAVIFMLITMAISLFYRN